MLSQEDEALSGPVSYSMWCDYFEHHDKLEDVWTPLTQDISNTKLIQHLLDVSGPVPFKLKEVLYDQLIGDPQWHYYIYLSLLHSRFDYFGQINVPKARSILHRLDLPEDTYVENLLKTLEADEDIPEEIQYQAKAKHGITSKLENPNNESTLH